MSVRLPSLLFGVPLFLLPLTQLLSAQDSGQDKQASPATPVEPAQKAPSAHAGNRLPEQSSFARVPAVWREGFESIRAEDCRKWLEVLAADDMEGRATGQPGFKKAADYVAARFKQFGLEPVGENGSYFQMVPFEGTHVDSGKSWLALLDMEGKEAMRIRVGKGLGGSIGGASTKTQDFVFVLAKKAEDIDRDLVQGKIVIFLDRSEMGPYGRSKGFVSLRRARPVSIVLIDEARASRDPGASRTVRFAGGRQGKNLRGRRLRPNQYALTPLAAGQLLKRAGLDGKLGEKAEAGTWSVSGYQLQTHIEVVTEPVFACNVIGMIRGRDPELSAEIVGIGSHLDHIGKRGTVINNGADDDGSGTTGLLALARAFAMNKTKPKRSLLFMAFCGEEMGLIGSRYYADNPIFENSRMVAELQMDMIGRNEEHSRSGEKAKDNINSLHLVGTKKLSDELHQICLDSNEKYGRFALEYDEEDVFGRSDHKNFAQKDIPIAFFFTGFHPQYHRPTDTIELINFPKLARVARLVYSIAWETAERENRPKVDRTYAEVMKVEQEKRLAERKKRRAQREKQRAEREKNGTDKKR